MNDLLFEIFKLKIKNAELESEIKFQTKLLQLRIDSLEKRVG